MVGGRLVYTIVFHNEYNHVVNSADVEVIVGGMAQRGGDTTARSAVACHST